MKNKENQSNRFGSTMFQRMFIIGVITILPLLNYAQWNNKPENFSSINANESNSAYQLKSFVVRCIEGKAYVMWVLIESTDTSLYLIERSADNINYKTIYAKKGAKSIHNIELMHSFIDENPLPEVSYYRMKRLASNEFNISKVVIINNNFPKGSVNSISLAQ